MPTVTATRNFSAQMRELIEQSIPKDDFVMALLAARIVQNLRATDPELLAGWLDELAESCMVSEIRHYEQAQRKRNRHNSSIFSEAASRFEDGDASALDRFTVDKFVVNDSNTWKSLGEMTGSDHRYVADRYRDRSKSNGLLAKFHEAVAQKIGNRTTTEVFSVSTYKAMEDSILKP